MNYDGARKTGDRLVEQLGGYNLKTVAMIGSGAFIVGYLTGGMAVRLLGPYYVLVLLLACLVAAVAFSGWGRAIFDRLNDAARSGPATGNRVPSDAAQPAPTRWKPPPKPSRQSAPAPVELSDLERHIVERAAQGGGNLSASAIAKEMGVSGDDVRKAVEELAKRGLIQAG